jgi:hypothetical protein
LSQKDEFTWLLDLHFWKPRVAVQPGSYFEEDIPIFVLKERVEVTLEREQL